MIIQIYGIILPNNIHKFIIGHPYNINLQIRMKGFHLKANMKVFNQKYISIRFITTGFNGKFLSSFDDTESNYNDYVLDTQEEIKNKTHYHNNSLI